MRIVEEGGMGAVIIKLADRLHNIRTLDGVSEQKRIRTIRETEESLLPFFELHAANAQSEWKSYLEKGVQLLREAILQEQ